MGFPYDAAVHGRWCAATLVLVLAGCAGSGDDEVLPDATTAGPTATTAPAQTTVITATTTAPTTIAPTSAPTIVPPTSAVATTAPFAPDALQRVEIGRSVQGRPIVAVERGTPGGTVVLVIGVIHGDEEAGLDIVDRLATLPLPPGVDLWLIEAINPDGVANSTRTNANQVDLNRNFPRRWAPLGQPGDWQYAGTGPASEPETQAATAFISAIRPELGIWYHQDLYRIAPGRGRAGEIRQRYAELTALPMVSISGGIYTGTASPWQQETVPDGVSFIVELGPTLSPEEADRHAAAVLTIAQEV
jgi:murein peptide amidase A